MYVCVHRSYSCLHKSTTWCHGALLCSYDCCVIWGGVHMTMVCVCVCVCVCLCVTINVVQLWYVCMGLFTYARNLFSEKTINPRCFEKTNRGVAAKEKHEKISTRDCAVWFAFDEQLGLSSKGLVDFDSGAIAIDPCPWKAVGKWAWKLGNISCCSVLEFFHRSYLPCIVYKCNNPKLIETYHGCKLFNCITVITILFSFLPSWEPF
jgi:hypothetical protein